MINTTYILCSRYVYTYVHMSRVYRVVCVQFALLAKNTKTQSVIESIPLTLVWVLCGALLISVCCSVKISTGLWMASDISCLDLEVECFHLQGPHPSAAPSYCEYPYQTGVAVWCTFMQHHTEVSWIVITVCGKVEAHLLVLYGEWVPLYIREH